MNTRDPLYLLVFIIVLLLLVWLAVKLIGGLD